MSLAIPIRRTETPRSPLKTMFRALTYQLLRAWHAILSGPRALLQLIVAPLKWIGQLFGRIVEWWSSRESKYLLRGIPSIVVFALAAYLLVACRLRSGTALADRYLTAAQRLNDPEAAALLYERVVSLRPNDDATLFELARQSIDAGDQTRAQVILQKLAPPGGQGYAPAQLFVGRHYLARQHLSNDYFKLAERHLTNALSLAPRDPRTNASLGMLYFRRGVWDLAVRHFEDALDPRYHDGGETDDNLHPIRLSLAKAYSFQGQLAKAESLARQAREHFAGRVEDNPREDIAARRYLAEACMFLEDFETASEVLQMGLRTQRRRRFAPQRPGAVQRSVVRRRFAYRGRHARAEVRVVVDRAVARSKLCTDLRSHDEHPR